MDYLFFVYGLAFVVVASICTAIPKDSEHGVPWFWLGLFGAFHGLCEWLDIFLVDLNYNPAVDMAKFAAMALSFVFLCIFARRALGSLQGKRPPGWLYVPLLALAASGALGGASVPETLNAMGATTRYALLLPGGLGTAWVLYLLGKREAHSRGILALAAIAMVGYTLSAGTIVAPAPFFPASALNSAWFLSAVGVPIQLVRAAFGVLLAASLWRYSKRLRQVDLSPKGNLSVTPLAYGLIIMLAVTLAAGWWLAEFASAWSDGKARDMLRAQAGTAAAGFIPLLAPLNGTTVDGTDAGHRQLRAQLMALGQAHAGLRSGRLLILRGGHILEVMAFDAKEPGRAAAGRAYEPPPKEVLEAFSRGKVTSLGPLRGSSGDLLSAFAPIRDPGTQAVAGVLGIDIDAAGWKRSMAGSRLVAISVTIVITLLAILFFLLRERMWRLAQLSMRSENRLVAAQEMVHLGSWTYDRLSGKAGWSKELFHICGREPKLGTPTDPELLQALIHPQDWPRVRSVMGRAVEQGAEARIEFRVVRPDGSLRQVEASAHASRNNGGRVVALNGIVQDLTDRKEARDRIIYLNRIYAVLSGINALIVHVKDRDELFRESCRIAVEAGGFSMALVALADRTTRQVAPAASAGHEEALLAVIGDIQSSHASPQRSMMARAMEERTVLVSNEGLNDSQALVGTEAVEPRAWTMAVLPLIVSDEAVGVLALYASEAGFFHEEELALLTKLVSDIAFAMDHLEKQEKLDYLSSHDVLTGLANRGLFLERVAQHMLSATSGGHRLAVFLLDLERFKNINDSLGRAAGNELLKQVAEWIRHASGDANLTARVGADHFALVLPKVRPEGNPSRLFEKFIEKLLLHPFHLDEAALRLSAKGGMALYPEDGADPEALFRNAETALKKAKEAGDRFLAYSQEMNYEDAERLNLENQLRHGFDRGEFVVHYQPKVTLLSGEITGAEALIRWNDPQTGLAQPGRFMPILERTGLIFEVGRWALRKAIEDWLRWRAAGLAVARIAVNVSRQQMRHHGFIADIEQAISIDAHAAAGLELEISESVMMEDIKHSIGSLQAIRAMGVSIAIDDFGSGFSSLSHLAKLPVDTLKIDHSFVANMVLAPEGLSLVSTIINLAHSVKLKVVAEGVETEEQSHLLMLLGCDDAQGFLFSKPVPSEDFETRFLAPFPTR
jgi:diguanylate cyclase (GGDEF)-like protein